MKYWGIEITKQDYQEHLLKILQVSKFGSEEPDESGLSERDWAGILLSANDPEAIVDDLWWLRSTIEDRDARAEWQASEYQIDFGEFSSPAQMFHGWQASKCSELSALVATE